VGEGNENSEQWTKAICRKQKPLEDWKAKAVLQSYEPQRR